MCMMQAHGITARYTIRSLPVTNHQDYSSLRGTLDNLRDAVDSHIQTNSTLRQQLRRMTSPHIEVTS